MTLTWSAHGTNCLGLCCCPVGCVAALLRGPASCAAALRPDLHHCRVSADHPTPAVINMMLRPCRECGGIAVLVDQLGSGMPDGSRTAAARALWFMARDDDNTHAISQVRLVQTGDMLQHCKLCSAQA